MKAKAILTSLFLSALFFSGCSSNPDRIETSFDPVAIFPNGDRIVWEEEHWSGTSLARRLGLSKPEKTPAKPGYVWRRANQPDKRLELFFPLPCIGSSPIIPPVDQFCVARFRAGENNDRVICVLDDWVIMSFDYASGLVIENLYGGNYGQPDWATPDFGREITGQPLFTHLAWLRH